jgi:hypothetical protein
VRLDDNVVPEPVVGAGDAVDPGGAVGVAEIDLRGSAGVGVKVRRVRGVPDLVVDGMLFAEVVGGSTVAMPLWVPPVDVVVGWTSR